MKGTKARDSSSFIRFCKQLSPKRKDTAKGIEGIEGLPTRSCSGGFGDEKRDFQAVFDYMDADRDGRISPQELRKSFETLGGQLSDEEAEEAVRLSDTDGDGMLDFEEFVNREKFEEDAWEAGRAEVNGGLQGDDPCF